MRMYDLIKKKRDHGALTEAEMKEMIQKYVSGEIPEYQMSAFLMAVYFQGMTKQETLAMTTAVAYSGERIDLSGIAGIKVDKHSTGGVGDKTTLIIAPMVAACGVKVAKMSGRGLGHTGGTIDKLESIPGLRTDLSREEFFKVVNQVGLSVIGQTGDLTPADKKLYALRDVTATVESIPLIAVSIMGKKLAAGSDCILLDVKTGSGAFMKTLEDAILLAEEMVAIGENAGKPTVALITNMDFPLGQAIGNSLEVIEAVKTLRGEGPKDLTGESISLAANMLYLAGKGELSQCKKMAEEVLYDGKALGRLIEMVEAQGGDSSMIRDTDNFVKAPFAVEIAALKSGFLTKMDTEKCGIASALLGAGRERLGDPIDPSAGIIIHAKTGDFVKKGESLATLYTSDKKRIPVAEEVYRQGVEIHGEAPELPPLVYARVSKDGIERYDEENKKGDR
ncbi:MAG: thymidine phosphorylase [Lachnospiraceae bacterium]